MANKSKPFTALIASTVPQNEQTKVLAWLQPIQKPAKMAGRE